jgi:hypothetical protein
VSITPQLTANFAAVCSILVALLAGPLLLGSYVVTQRAGILTQFLWFGGLLALLATALVLGIAGLLLLG